MTNDEQIFPSAKDLAANRRSLKMQQKAAEDIERRASEITNPDDLVEFILEVAGKRFRAGRRKIKLTVEVPSDNFQKWAHDRKLGSPDWDSLDRMAVKNEVTRLARESLKRRVGSGVFPSLVVLHSNPKCITFKVQISVMVR